MCEEEVRRDLWDEEVRQDLWDEEVIYGRVCVRRKYDRAY